MNIQLEKLFQSGKLVKLHIGMWSMQYSLDEDDLGVKDIPDIVKLGQKFLIKPEQYLKFKKVESAARNFLRKKSFNYMSDSFVPINAFIPVMDELAKYKQEFSALVKEFIDNYETHKQEMFDAYPEWRSKLERFYPKADSLEEKFYFSVMAYEISMPKEIQEVDVHTELLREKKVEDYMRDMNTRMEQEKAKLLKEAEKFAFEAATSLRDKINEAALHVANKIAKKQVVSKTNVATLKNVIQDFKLLNFLDDKAMSEQLNKLETVLNENTEFRSDDAIKDLDSALGSIKTLIDTASDVSNITGEYYRKISL